MLIWFLPLFLLILMIGTPVVFALLFAPGFMTWITGNERDLAILYRNVYTGIDSFPLMALPFFMLAGEVMNRGGITTRLVEFSQAFMGHLRGGLAQVNILSSILFAGLSGSAVADTSALGSTLIPAMEKNGYTRRFAAAITAASSVIGPIIPPSGIMIIYAYVMGESVAALFLAGIVPGILVGVGLMVMVRLMADRYDLPKAERIVTKNQTIKPIEHWLSFILARINLMGVLWALFRLVSSFTGIAKPEGVMLAGTLIILLIVAHVLLVALRGQVSSDFRLVMKKGVVPLQTPIIILGGILVGIMTPTEASTIAVAYALLVSVFVLKSLTWADFFDVLQRSALASAAVLLLVGAAVAFKTIVATSGAATTMADAILGLSENPLILLFLINILLFIVGMFLDAGPAIIMSVNLTVGLATPPMGLVLFVASTVSREKVETIAKAILPFLAVEVVVIFLITFFPQISMTVPYLADFLGCPPDLGYMACNSPGPPAN
jgi:TRAP-type C4-dicarboxylate transport system permease large subunit